MKILITGSRGTPATDYQKLADAIQTHCPNCSEILHGGAIGADQLAKKYAITNGLKETEIKPDYKKYGKVAPLIRNNEMLKIADKVISWQHGKTETRGTAYTTKRAERLGKLAAKYKNGKQATSGQMKLL